MPSTWISVTVRFSILSPKRFRLYPYLSTPPPPCLFHYPPVLQCHILRLAPASPSTVCSGYATSPISGLGAPDGNSTQPSTQKTFTDEEIKDESLLKNSGSYSECYVLEEFNLAYLKLTCCKAQLKLVPMLLPELCGASRNISTSAT